MQRPCSPHRILPVNAAKKSTPPVKAEAALCQNFTIEDQNLIEKE